MPADAMRIIRHRVNTLAALRAVHPSHGAELDVRSVGSRLVLNHEPFEDGETLEDFLACYAQRGLAGTLIFNPKEDGLEREILRMARRFQIQDFFFLDLTMPTTVRCSMREGIADIAVRVSEYEPIEAALRFRRKVRWIWLDCFTGKPAKSGLIRALKGHFKVCAASPELQGYAEQAIRDFEPLIPLLDAVCTKRPDLWGCPPA